MSRYLTDEEYSSLLSENRNLKSQISSLTKGSYIDSEKSKHLRIIKRQEKMISSRDNKIDKLSGELYRANKRIKQLEEKVKQLEDENNKYKIQVNKDYTNSSLPSSSSSFIKKINNSRQKTDRKPGGQLGHKGHPRRSYTPDEIIYLKPDDNILKDNNYIKTDKQIRKQVIDVSLSFKVIEYVADVYINKTDNSRYHQSFPNNINNEVNYGSSIKGLAYLLNNYCNVSIDKIIELFKQLSSDKLILSKGFINNLNKQFSDKSKEELNDLFTTLTKADVLYTDNTNGRVNGKSKFIYVTTDKNKVIYNYADHKGHKGIELTPVSSSLATLVHDHDKSFYSYGKNHQECLAHILRYLESSIENEPDITWSSKMKTLIQEIIHEHKKNNGVFDEKKINEYKSRYKQIIETGLIEYKDNPPNKYYMDGFNLLKRMREYEDSTLYFLNHPQVNYTNNISERLLRKVKRKMKQVTTFRSEDNLSYYLDGLSIIETTKANNNNIYQEICKIFDK